MKITVLASTFALLICACGSGSPPANTNPPGVPTGNPPAVTQAPVEGLTPGTINYRLVNLYHDAAGAPAAVDVYVRTQGLVRAAPVVMGLAFGALTETFAPPEPGTVAVLTAGAADPTCVATCPHIISITGTGFGEGKERTMIIYDEGSLELWHDPEPASVGSSGNALAPADPSAALVYIVGVGLHDADFGLRLGFDGEAGCQVNRTAENILIGGNQVAVFAFEGGSADALLFGNSDSECAEDPVGGPFAVSGAAGSRTMLVLYGEPGDMESLTLEI